MGSIISKTFAMEAKKNVSQSVSISRREKTKDPDEPFHLPVKGRVSRLAPPALHPLLQTEAGLCPQCQPCGQRQAGCWQWAGETYHWSFSSLLHEPLPSSLLAFPSSQGSWLGPGTADLWESSQDTCKQERRSHCLLNSLTNDDHLLWEQNVFVCELTFKPRCFKTVISKLPSIQFWGPFLRGGVCEVAG